MTSNLKKLEHKFGEGTLLLTQVSYSYSFRSFTLNYGVGTN